MWKNILDLDRQQTTTWCLHISFWIPKTTNTHSQYITLIALPLQERLHKRALMLRYTYIVCLVYVLYSMDYVDLIYFNVLTWDPFRNLIILLYLKMTWIIIHSLDIIVERFSGTEAKTLLYSAEDKFIPHGPKLLNLNSKYSSCWFALLV
jgi:hypothetical protein